MTHSEELVLLTTAPSALEASMIRTALEGAGIHVVLHGEHFATLDPRLSQLAGVGVLVRRSDLSAAQALLADGRPVLEGPDGPSLDGAVCPVHERAATGTCDRCGTFLCSGCPALGDPPLCEDCVDREVESMPRPRWRGRVVKATAILCLLPFVLGLLAFIGLAVARLWGWRP